MNRLHSECIRCILRKYMELIPDQATEQVRLEYLRRLIAIVGEAQDQDGSPVVVEKIALLKKELFGLEDDYSEVKVHFNDVMLSYEEELRRTLREARDPLKLAIQYAMSGNYIDFGAMQNVDEHYLKNLLFHSSQHALPERTYKKLRADLETAENLVLLTDNCGEIVMDKLLIETIKARYPQIRVTVIVRGAPVLNDATMEDARQVGLTDVATVIGNGNAIGGTCLERLSPEAKAAVDRADVLLSKGQGNFETLQGCNLNVYYLFLCKCELFARRFSVPQYSGMLVNDKDLH